MFVLSAVAASASAHTYFLKHGYLAAGGDDSPPAPYTVDGAKAKCSASPTCKGITFMGPVPSKPSTIVSKVYFKKQQSFDADSSWTSLLRDYTPPGPLMNNPCTNASSPQARLPWCDPTLSVSVRVADMISRMTLDEKIQQGATNAPNITSLSLNAYNWWSESSHGVASGDHGARDTATTNFAFPITTGMSFNRSLWRVTGAKIGTEARALMNAGKAYSTFWAPVINLAREPRW